MAISQSASETAYRCPTCTGDLAVRYDSFECTDCGFTPRHGSD
ncbi:uncharacterized protein Nmag_0616 [Natrialba magadii ATCC 43099]|uniref:Uncharacterized protein n=1 Tax=Natrialba magadii (strain ATCC 43099 / DSM 3394 / CCM 3739 / CIP 104546 / IAM 13178 / JCM 8861 / NBRC 102185 / NCIMB 2190 / MS3) TaxID=547559 RepID=D3SYU1_NATMM|nr:hypothetical protein [Natrialba magadii]ADD04202.1 uncharacterized protein Nmag_0616 [Natrialba magadii ATCC 43099]ELY26606.1 hypothetical protein C500_15625 [Natrialba magadii ATCC 43099]